METDADQLRQASYSALSSLLNLTLLPVISFIVLLMLYRQAKPASFARYHAVLAIKTNLYAVIALFVVTGLMIALGGFHSPWTWVYVLSYFMFVHSMFILFATWTLTRCWAGKKLNNHILVR